MRTALYEAANVILIRPVKGSSLKSWGMRLAVVKELRLAGIRTLAEGNALLPTFITDYNARFDKPPANQKDLHRPLCVGDDLEEAFAWKEERRVSQALTLQYDKMVFILEPSEPAKATIGKYVTVFDYPMASLRSVIVGSSSPIAPFISEPTYIGTDPSPALLADISSLRAVLIQKSTFSCRNQFFVQRSV